MGDDDSGREREQGPAGRRLPIGATLLLLLAIALFVWLVDWVGGQLGLGAEEPPPEPAPRTGPGPGAP